MSTRKTEREKDIYVYVGGFEMPDKNAAAHRVMNIGKILNNIGKSVVYIGVDKKKSICSKVLSSCEKIDSFDCYSVGYPIKYTEWIGYLSNAKRYIEVIERIGNVSGIIFYNFPSVAMRNLMEYCRRSGIKCYADVTEWYSGKGQGLLWGIVKTFDSWYRMRIMHKKMDGLIVISSYLENYYKKCPNVVCIPALTDLSDMKWENHYVKSSDVLKLVYGGWPQKKDRIDILIEAVIQLKRSYHLDIIGITKAEYLNMYPRHKNWIQNDNRIAFHGRLTHNETLDYVKKANYSCFFRMVDRVSKAGFPTKFVEAISCETPVITNNTSDLKKYITKDVNGYLVNLDDTLKNFFETVQFLKNVDASQLDYHSYISKIKILFQENAVIQ